MLSGSRRSVPLQKVLGEGKEKEGEGGRTSVMCSNSSRVKGKPSMGSKEF